MPDHSQTKTVLVVDDHEQVTDLFATWLAPEYEVLVATDATDALELLADRAIDVVLLDRGLPDLSGDELLVTIRDRGYDARVAFVSGREPQTDVLDLGFDDYLVKPVDREAVVETVGRLLAVRPYDEIRRELTELRVRRNVLQAEIGAERLAEDERFADLLVRIDELETRAEEYGAACGEERALVSP